MGYKKTWTGAMTTGALTNTLIIDRLNRIVTEFELAGVMRTSDTGQININSFDIASLTPRPFTGIIGYLMFKVFDNCFLRFDVRFGIAANSIGNMVLVPNFGASTNGAGVFTSGTTNSTGATAGINYQMTQELDGSSNFPCTSFIYKSDNTFWFTLDIDKGKTAAVAGGQAWRPTSVGFVTKTLDNSFSVVDNAFHCYIPRSSVLSGSFTADYVRSFTPNDVNGIKHENALGANVQYNHTLITIDLLNSTDPIYFFQPVLGTINGRTGFNYDMLFVRINALGSTPFQEITLNVNGVNRNYLFFWNGSSASSTNGYILFNIASGFSNVGSVLIWD